jgi:FAD-linked sulfhydryl oxidase
MPPDMAQENFGQWMCELHNDVNILLDKDIFDCANVDMRWGYGWPDGHCKEL